LAADITKIPKANKAVSNNFYDGNKNFKKSFLSGGEIDYTVGRDSRISSSHNSYQFLPSNQ
jgi:hypothetical protein